jgi:hypothetical protein
METMSNRYAELTERIGERYAGAADRLRNLQVDALERARDFAGRYLPELPELPFASRPPAPQAIARANFALAETLLEAQKRYTLGLLDAIAGPARRSRARHARTESEG